MTHPNTSHDCRYTRSNRAAQYSYTETSSALNRTSAHNLHMNMSSGSGSGSAFKRSPSTAPYMEDRSWRDMLAGSGGAGRKVEVEVAPTHRGYQSLEQNASEE